MIINKHRLHLKTIKNSQGIYLLSQRFVRVTSFPSCEQDLEYTIGRVGGKRDKEKAMER
jgi:hypothetical protein